MSEPGDPMNPSTPRDRQYPADRAFVVQLDLVSDARGQFAGRVEHVVSGEVAHFQAPAELLAFIGRVLGRLAP